MASVEIIFLINFILNIVIAVSGIIVAMLIPGTRKILAGEAGASMGAAWMPFVLGAMVLVSIAVFPLSFIALEDRNLYFALVLDVIAIAVTGMALREFFTARKAYRELEEGHGLEEVAVVATTASHHGQQVHVPEQHPYHGHAQHHQHPAQPQHAPVHAHSLPPEHHEHAHHPHQHAMITVECPQCGNHLHIPEGSHTITCPHCGLSGTI